MSCIQTRGLAYGQIRYNDLSIEGGKATFISGPSGSGKSTLLRLFNKTIAPTAGAVLYNGQNMDDIDSITLRREVLLAGQSVFLFDRSVGENFDAYCEARESEPLSAEDKQNFLRLCCANFPLDAPCVHLSGGERQRVFLAICLSFLPKVLMLDEPTSALDAETEALIMEGLERLMHNRTTFVIAHRLSMMRRADMILVIKNQRIHEMGSYDELMAQNGEFARLHAIQMGKGKPEKQPPAPLMV